MSMRRHKRAHSARSGSDGDGEVWNRDSVGRSLTGVETKRLSWIS